MNRSATVTRKTKETDVTVKLDLAGGGVSVSTGIGFFDHMLTALGFYSGFGLELTAQGDLHVDGHHTVEDVGIVLGQALKQALGDRDGIARFATAFVPMDEALARVVLDISSRPYLVCDAAMPQERIGDYDSCLTQEFLRAFAVNAGLTLHVAVLYGANAHHITEAIFKALGMALKQAAAVSGRGATSTKGTL